jgi:hypothetical protein
MMECLVICNCNMQYPRCTAALNATRNHGGRGKVTQYIQYEQKNDSARVNTMHGFHPFMDQITTKPPNHKVRLYWCLLEFIDWRYSQSCRYFRPLMWTSAPLTFSMVCLPPPSPLPSVNKYRGINKRGGGDRVVWRACTGVIHSVFDQIPP